MRTGFESLMVFTLSGMILVGGSLATDAQEHKRGKERFQEDKAVAEADDLWIYNDLAAARAEADRTGRPILLVFR